MTTELPKHHTTKDGSSTLFSSQFGQYYHNPNGAVSESKHVFFDVPRVEKALSTKSENLSFFEVGFGTGLNFLLLLDKYLSLNLDLPVHFYSVEAFPIGFETVESLNYEGFFENPEIVELLPNIFNSIKPGLNDLVLIPHKNIHLHLYYGFMDELESLDHSIDFIFHDAFSPDVNSDLWTVSAFEKLASFSKPNVILSTYCASSKARAAMAKAGWKLAKAQGALGKREMTVASLYEDKLAHLKRIPEARLITRYDSGDFN